MDVELMCLMRHLRRSGRSAWGRGHPREKPGVVRDGQEVVRKCAYVVCAGGRRFTDRELFDYSAPMQLPSKADSDAA